MPGRALPPRFASGLRASAGIAAALLALFASSALAAEPVPPATPLTLADVVRLASSATAPVEIAQLKLDESGARVGQARSALLPSLTGSASAVNRTQASSTFGFSFPTGPSGPIVPDLVGPTQVLDARLRVSQTVFDLASWKKLRAAGLGVQQSRAEQVVASETAAQGAALAWARLARADAVVKAREADLAIAQELQSLADAQRDAGTAPAIDATRARTQVATSRGALLVARNQQERARVDFARSLGFDAGTRLELADTLSFAAARSDVPEAPDAALALALERRPELRSEQAKLQRAHVERAAIGAERLPHLDALADVGPSGTQIDNAVTTRQYGLAFTWPVFDGARRESRLTEQALVQREAEVRERDLRRQIDAELRAAQLDLSSGLEQRSVAEERLRLADDELAQARERFVNGVAGNIEIINAQSSLVRARDADIEARFVVASARIALARAAGVARTLR